MKNFFEDLFFWRTLAAVSLVLGLGLDHSCPWPQRLCPQLHLWQLYRLLMISSIQTVVALFLHLISVIHGFRLNSSSLSAES